jgi:Flp pilus assembly protein TadD
MSREMPRSASRRRYWLPDGLEVERNRISGRCWWNFPTQESKLDPLNGDAYERMGDAYIQAGDFFRAQYNLNRAVLLEPTVSAPFILLGKALLRQENPLMARMYLEHALQMDPNSYMAHYLLGQTYRLLGRTDEAQREYRATEQIQAAIMPKLESLP